MTPEDFSRVTDVYRRAVEKTFQETKDRHVRKLERLRESTRRRIEHSTSIDDRDGL